MDEPAQIHPALHELALALAVVVDSREVLDFVAGRVRDLLQANAVAIFAWDEAAHGFVVVQSTSAGMLGRTVQRSVGALGAAFDQHCPIVVNDQPDPSDTSAWDPALEVHALAAVPLIVAGEAVGAIVAGRLEPYSFTKPHVNLLSTLGGLTLAPTLERARLRGRIQELELRTSLLQSRSQTRELTMRLQAGRLLEQVRDSPAMGIPRLSPREREILPLLAQGRTNREIGATLGLTHGTTRNLVARTLMKLGARDRTHAVVIALASGNLQA